ncbi:MAG: DUF2892 domain-containing protein [Abitibacteriaceae bacterium]|nr:DUF2892 domain-containing protein [Abditibacteriaceae bacterium]MBV9864856.1 DUF2892 domain-containing protein [Abditibacteriaceae bacterium]
MEEANGSMDGANVGEKERWASLAGGGALLLYGLSRKSLGGMIVAALGGSLLYRGVTQHCPVYSSMGINTAEDNDAGIQHSPVASVRHNHGIKVEKSVTINKSPEELYRFWRDFTNLPHFMKHLESVEVLDDKKSHWVVKAPAGLKVEWDATIHNEKENELIAWRSLEGQVNNAGSVHFTAAPDGRGTEVRVVLEYEPPAGTGTVGATIAKLFGEEPGIQVEDDLRRFKQLMEAGEIATVEGQPHG